MNRWSYIICSILGTTLDNIKTKGIKSLQILWANVWQELSHHNFSLSFPPWTHVFNLNETVTGIQDIWSTQNFYFKVWGGRKKAFIFSLSCLLLAHWPQFTCNRTLNSVKKWWSSYWIKTDDSTHLSWKWKEKNKSHKLYPNMCPQVPTLLAWITTVRNNCLPMRPDFSQHWELQ